VVAGHGVVVDEGQERPIAPEDIVFVPGGTMHNFKSTGDSALRLLCLIPTSAC
jgi:mannose-6-phosphate isomerase-like protein (cupin superfamily)